MPDTRPRIGLARGVIREGLGWLGSARGARRHRHTSLVAVASVAVLAALALMPARAMAASPFPTPGSADQLACDLSPANDPSDFLAWWTTVSQNSTFAGWFWNDIMPNNASTNCRSDTAGTFWAWAVPANWAPTSNIGGWPWAGGGYYTQMLWLHAVPDNWASVTNIGGWPSATGGYYAQWFWLHAVPENWAFTANIGGWPWASGGYYAQWFWLHAVPDNWAFTANIGGWPWASGGYYTQMLWLHTVPENWAFTANIGGWPWASGGYYTQWFWLHAVPDNWATRTNLALGRSNVRGNQGYFRYWFWEGAVPDAWSPVGNIGGWTSATDGYYTQWFWLHAAPDQWANDPRMAIGGSGGRGYYDYFFYHFATVRDFAWRSSLSLGGSQGAGYFDFLYHGSMGQNFPHYKELLALAGGYLGNTPNFVPVSTWFAPGTQAVVALTFDTEGVEAQTCAISAALRQQAVAATFYLTGFTADALTTTWAQCLSGFDIQNHTVDHPGAFDLQPRTFMETLPSADQIHQIRDNVPHIQAKLPGAAVTSFRTPWCDSNKTIDGSVVQSMIASGMKSDRSVITVPKGAVQAGVVPPLGLSQFSLSAFPSPFTISAANGQLVEFPFTYPSDWAAANVHGLDSRNTPPSPGAPGYAVTLWEKEFDEIYSQHGIMVILMHPWVQSPNGESPDGLNTLITYMKSKPGVAFTTATTANLTFRVASGMP